MTLNQLNVGDRVKITGFSDQSSAYRKKLLAMGLTPGTEFTLTRIAPLGDPVEITIRGFALILRKDEAKILKIEKVES